MLSFDWWLNLATFAGIAILAAPVLSLNRRKRKLHEVRRADVQAQSDSEFRKRTREILSEKHKKNVEDWRAIDQYCLIAGYLLLLGSAFFRIVIPPT